MNRLAIDTQTAREGDILEWLLVDENYEPVIRDLTRREARELKRECGGHVCKVVLAH